MTHAANSLSSRLLEKIEMTAELHSILHRGRPRILITRTDRIGDLVLSTPVFKALRERYPDAWLACLTFLENRELVEGNPYLDEVLLYDKRGSERGVVGNLRFITRLQKRRFDIAIHLHATNRMHLLTWLAGIPVRIGWDRRLPWALSHVFAYRKKEGEKHEAEYNFDLLSPLGVEVPSSPETYVAVSERARKSLAMLLAHLGLDQERPWLVLNPSASCPSKMWPAERFGELACRLGQRYNLYVVTIGTFHDRDRTQRVGKILGGRFYDLSGRLSLGMLAALLEQAALLVSNDSGPVHIAQAVGTPVVSIFGRKDPGLSPRRWRPLGRHSSFVWKDVGCTVCLAHRCQINFLCLDAVSVEDVLEEVERFADRFHPARRMQGELSEMKELKPQ